MIVTMNSNLECNLPFSKTSILSVVIQDLGNPFSEESNVLLVPDTKIYHGIIRWVRNEIEKTLVRINAASLSIQGC